MSIAGPPLPTEFPTPRDGLDTGSIAELALDCSEIRLPAPAAVAPAHPHVDIVVPEDASALSVGRGDSGC